jgi:hypothetical protein
MNYASCRNIHGYSLCYKLIASDLALVYDASVPEIFKTVQRRRGVPKLLSATSNKKELKRWLPR